MVHRGGREIGSHTAGRGTREQYSSIGTPAAHARHSRVRPLQQFVVDGGGGGRANGLNPPYPDGEDNGEAVTGGVGGASEVDGPEPHDGGVGTWLQYACTVMPAAHARQGGIIAVQHITGAGDARGNASDGDGGGGDARRRSQIEASVGAMHRTVAHTAEPRHAQNCSIGPRALTRDAADARIRSAPVGGCGEQQSLTVQVGGSRSGVGGGASEPVGGGGDRLAGGVATGGRAGS